MGVSGKVLVELYIGTSQFGNQPTEQDSMIRRDKYPLLMERGQLIKPSLRSQGI